MTTRAKCVRLPGRLLCASESLLIPVIDRACQRKYGDKDRCKFFLWDSEAHPREAAALANNTRTEPGRAHEATPITPRPQRVSPPPPYTPQAGPSEPSRKRTRTAVEEDEDEYGVETGDAAFNDELDQVMTAVETPTKIAKTADFSTPARRRLPWQKDDPARGNGLLTPQTNHRATTADPFNTRFAAPGGSLFTPSKQMQPDSAPSQTMTPSSSPIATPTPKRFKDVSTGDDLFQDVFGVFDPDNPRLDERTRRDLTAVLSKHATITEGIKRGREVARSAIKAEKAKVTELTYRVNTLEAELEAERNKSKLLQWQVETGHRSD